jgi:hypothetical protein
MIDISVEERTVLVLTGIYTEDSRHYNSSVIRKDKLVEFLTKYIDQQIEIIISYKNIGNR